MTASGPELHKQMADFDKLDSFFQVENKTAFKERTKLNHGQRVRLAKLILPCIAAALLAMLVIIPQLRQSINEIKFDITKPKVGELEKLHVENTVFYITDKDNNVHNITATNIDETEPGSKLVKIKDPEGTMPYGPDTWFNIKSPVGYYNQELNTLKLTNDVEGFYSDGVTLEVPDMIYDFNKGIAYSKSPVSSQGFFGDLISEGFVFVSGNSVLTFVGKTVINLDENSFKGNQR